MSKTKGFITDIQRFSLHDGPGIRTTVFMGGCNLRCAWCHNPETISPERQWQYLESRCIGCGACMKACPHQALCTQDGGIIRDSGRCTRCEACAEACYPGAIRMVGEEIDAHALWEVLQRDAHFYAQGGGVTFSGGEPLLQPLFLTEMLQHLHRRHIHTAVDTAGCVPWHAFEAIRPSVDLFLYDMKGMDPAVHKRYTGAENQLMLENLCRISTSGARIWIRIPLIHGVNDSTENLEATANFLDTLEGVQQVDVLPYHDYGRYKAQSLSFREQSFTAPDAQTLERARVLLGSKERKVFIH